MYTMYAVSLMLSLKWRSKIIDSGTPSVRMPPFNQAEPSAVSRRSRLLPPARRDSQAPSAPMNGSASIHSGASTIDTPFRVKNTQGGNCGTRSATNCTATEMRRVDRTGAHNCRARMFMASSLLHSSARPVGGWIEQADFGNQTRRPPKEVSLIYDTLDGALVGTYRLWVCERANFLNQRGVRPQGRARLVGSQRTSSNSITTSTVSPRKTVLAL